MDVYERDFIADTGSEDDAPPSPRGKARYRSGSEEFNNSGSEEFNNSGSEEFNNSGSEEFNKSESGGVRSAPKKAVLLSSEEEEEENTTSADNYGLRGRDSPDSDHIQVGRRRTAKRRLYSSAVQLSTSEEEEEEGVRMKEGHLKKKPRRMKFRESDDEIE